MFRLRGGYVNAHSVEIGADCIMLSEETAGQKWFDDCVLLSEYLKKLAPPTRLHYIPVEHKKYPEIWQLVKHLGEFPVLLRSKSGMLFSILLRRNRKAISTL